MSDQGYAETDATPTTPPRMEQWVDNLTNAHMRLVNITNELHGFCDRVNGSLPQADPATAENVRRIESSGMMHDVQQRIDSLGEALAAAEGAISRLNSIGL
jgi:uncharacterized protein YdaT